MIISRISSPSIFHGERHKSKSEESKSFLLDFQHPRARMLGFEDAWIVDKD